MSNPPPPTSGAIPVPDPVAREGAAPERGREAQPTSDRDAELTLVLRPRTDTSCPSAAEVGHLAMSSRRHFSRAQLIELRGAHPDDLAAVQAWADGTGLQVLEMRPGQRLVRLSGSTQRLAREFGVSLGAEDLPEGRFRVMRGQVRIPAPLVEPVVAVLGLDTRPVARPHFRRLPLPPGPLAEAAPLSYEPSAVAAIYQFPAGSSGSGECIGLIELGGGFQPADLNTYFGQLGLPVPVVVTVPVAGGANLPTGNPDGPDGEVTLDIEVAGSAAPGIRLAAYFAPNTDQGFLEAVSTAIHDELNRPTAISISWGGPEVNWPAATITAFDQAFQDAALVGITVCVAAGDSGSSDGLTDGLAHVDFPASSPHVLACGGTRLLTSGLEIVREVVWDDLPQGGATGGGVSAVFPPPGWQSAAGVPVSANPGHLGGRGVPDVAGDADPQTGYRVLVDGLPAVFGGTSAVAPLWAALLARCSGALGRPLGYVNPLLYQTLAAEEVTRDIVQGDNGAYAARVGWDACTGWGSPIGTRLLSALGG
ncbi:MAG: S53 family peptidase [Candidatus Dormibacteria bacterium]